MTLALRYAVRSDVGLLREGNEDSAYAGPHLLAVADGMGGYEAGEVASAAVISAVAPLDRQARPESDLIDALSSAVAAAKQTLRRIVEADPAVGSMGTTLTAMLWSGGSAAICHIGDSRAYLLRDGDLYQITKDHTFVQTLIDEGRIRPEDAATHPQRSLLLRALDGRSDAHPDLSMLSAQPGDRYLLCSDGLSVAVSDEAILQALAEVREPADVVLRLIELAIAGGGPDNITCIVADVIDPDRDGIAPTRSPVVAGAAAATGGAHDFSTKPFDRPPLDDAGRTRVGTVPAATGTGGPVPEMAPAGSVTRPPGPGRAGGGTAADHRLPADGEPDDRPARTRRRWPLVTTILVIFVVVVAGGIFAIYQYAQTQYYVSTSNGKVAIFRGLDQKLLGVSITSVYDPTDIPVSGLPDTDRQAIARSSTTSLARARAFLVTLRSDYQKCQAAYAAVRHWETHKTKTVRKLVKVNGKPVHKTTTEKLPRPKIPAGCPPRPAS